MALKAPPASVLLRAAKEARSQTKLSVQPQLESVVPSARSTPAQLNDIAAVLGLVTSARQFCNCQNSLDPVLLSTTAVLLCIPVLLLQMASDTSPDDYSTCYTAERESMKQCFLCSIPSRERLSGNEEIQAMSPEHQRMINDILADFRSRRDYDLLGRAAFQQHVAQLQEKLIFLAGYEEGEIDADPAMVKAMIDETFQITYSKYWRLNIHQYAKMPLGILADQVRTKMIGIDELCSFNDAAARLGYLRATIRRKVRCSELWPVEKAGERLLEISEVEAIVQTTRQRLEGKICEVYALIDPRDNIERYVGCTVNLKGRYGCHIGRPAGENKQKDEWIAELKRLGLRPPKKVLETVKGVEAKERETYWIYKLLGEGKPLLNYQGKKLEKSKSKP